MKLQHAAFLDLASVQRGDLDLSSLISAVAEWQWFDNINDASLKTALADVDVVISNKILLGSNQLQRAKNLKLICIAATGTNNVDLDAAAANNIAVCNVRAYATASVVQHVFAMLLTLTTRLDEYRNAVQRGDWARSEHFCLLDYPIRELAGKTLGIVGYGELGKAVANVARAFGMDIVIAKRDANDKRAGRQPLQTMLASVDVLSLHCPLTDATRGLIGAHEMGLMKNDAVLINTARGGIVDEVALVSALENGQLGGAAIDTLEQEPPASDYSLLQQALPNLIVTPHVAWASRESRQRLINELGLNISAFANGENRNRVI